MRICWAVILSILGATVHPLAQQRIQIDQSNFYSAEVSPVEGINTEKLEFSPFIYEDGLAYISATDKGVSYDKVIDEGYFEAFSTHGIDPFQAINVGHEHIGPLHFDKNQNQLYYTQSKRYKRSKRKPINKILVSRHRENGIWHRGEEVIIAVGEYSVQHPTLTLDGSMLVFSSDMPDGYGDFDLYFCRLQDSVWSSPVAFGPSINSAANDAFPFLYQDSILFFASDGRGGFGGYDIYVSIYEDGRWQNSVNLGKVVNSEGDDLGFVLKDDSRTAYLSSNRSGSQGKDDIFRILFQNKLIEFFEIKKPATPHSIVEEITIEEPKDTIVTIEPEPEKAYQLPPDYHILISEPIIPEIDPNAIAQKLEVTAYIGPRINFDNQTELISEAPQPAIEKPIVAAPLGQQQLNLIVQSGSTGKRIDHALVIVRPDDGNKKYYWTDRDGTTRLILTEGQKYTLSIESEGSETYHLDIQSYDEFRDLTISLTSNGVDNTLTPVTSSSAASDTNIDFNTVELVVFDQLYYEYNSPNIQSGSTEQLDQLISYMKLYNNMTVELIAHTDSRGKSDFNLKLSVDRAQAAKQYLTFHGIEPQRIITFGKGESEIRNHCTDGVKCSEEEHEYNRRTEVRVIWK